MLRELKGGLDCTVVLMFAWSALQGHLQTQLYSNA